MAHATARRYFAVNGTVKAWSERGLVAARIPALGRKLRRDQALGLAYHNVVPDDLAPSGDRSLHLRFSDFRRQLDILEVTHDLISLERLLAAPTGGAARPRAVLTFDDAYHGALELAIPEVVARGLPVTVFVAPALLGTDAFWWDALSDNGGEGLAPELRKHALGRLEGRQNEILAWAKASGIDPNARLPEALRPATRDEVLGAAEHPSVEIGSHSWSHPDLTSLAAAALEEELARAWRWHASNVGTASAWIAYPYGRHDEKVREIAGAVGYEAAVAGGGGWTRLPPEERFAVRRFNVPAGMSEAGFRLRTSGVPLP